MTHRTFAKQLLCAGVQRQIKELQWYVHLTAMRGLSDRDAEGTESKAECGTVSLAHVHTDM